MAISKNNPIQKNHFRKQWQERVRVHLDQAGKKKSRRVARDLKAALVAPRPVDKLRPIVRAPTLRYNRKVRAGRGFTFEELHAAGLSPKYARTVGIAVDHRRINRNVEGLELNVQRLKEYTARLVVFPKNADKEFVETKVLKIADDLPISNTTPIVSTGKVADVESANAFQTLRKAFSDKRHAGKREKKAREAAEAENK
ncbi:ribosomal 60S subunit protein L13A [Starmerella bacillaris]|uniref:60S ribosomal protein L13 n=1 Tax=Starmerella bacillaris TaxID=1247836 RepID=A0AAV5RBV4_STABA|nr:ribosomal 60S subunit protein L13A [Starmerella bacillaris]